MKNLQDMLLSIVMVGFVVVVFVVNCDADAQARPMNTLTRTVARVVTSAVVAAPEATHVAIEVSEISWNFDGRAPLARTADGCSEWRAQRPGERVWYRIRVCGAEVVETIRRIP